ncbi:MAG: hypothetical protein HPY53_09565 [Brevinematales bacterium]|nr:hypothetical protein [Brevinematales bacterium]
MKRISFQITSLLIFALVALSGCWSLTDEPTFRTELRPGEDPGHAGTTNYQYVSNVTIYGTVLATINDADGDYKGDGTLRMPPAILFPDVFDIHQVIITADSTNVYFYIAFQDRYYSSPDDATNSVAGFFNMFVGIQIGQAGDMTGNPNIQFFAPIDGTQDQLDTKVNATGFTFKYGIGLIGNTPTDTAFSQPEIPGTLFDAFGNSGSIGDIKTGPNLTNVQSIFTPYEYPNTCTTFVVVVPRGTWLTAGEWRILIFSWNWQDYGHNDHLEYPGFNGHLRENSGGIPVSWQFGSSGGSVALMADIVTSDSNVQKTILTKGSEAVTADQCITVTLP